MKEFKAIVNQDFYPEVLELLIKRQCNLFLVQAEYQRPGTDDKSSDFKGIDLALELDSDRIPILLCSFMPINYFLKDQEFSVKLHALMGKPKVGFMDSISNPESFYNKYLELLNSKKEEDLLAEEIKRLTDDKKQMGLIKHAISRLSDYNDPKAQECILRAREIGVEGTDQEVFQQILDFKYDLNYNFAGKYFPGVFCDLEGTLIVNDQLNTNLLEKLKELSLTKPITLWTAGDVDGYREKLISQGIFWKVLSKFDFRGAEVEIAYDDLSYHEFYSRFEIKAREFHKVSINETSDEDMELKLEFLHSILLPSGIPEVLKEERFSIILNVAGIRDLLKEMEAEEDQSVYKEKLILIRDILLPTT